MGRLRRVRSYVRLVLSVAGLGLVFGCGSSHHTGGNAGGLTLGRQSVSGAVTLPQGSAPGSVLNSLGTTPVTGGQFTLAQFAGNSQLAVATSPGGHVMLAGFLGAGQTTLSPQTTAVVLVYFASGANLLPQQARDAALAQLTASADLAPLSDAIAAALAGGPENLAPGSPGAASVAQALQTVLNTLHAQARGRALVISPTESKSGLTVSQTQGTDAVVLTNTFARPGTALIQRVSTFDSQGQETASAADVTTISIRPAATLQSTTGTLAQLLWGQNSFTSTATDAVPLPLTTGASKTRYRVVVLGPGAGAGDFATLTDAQKAQQTAAAHQFVVAQVVLPLVLDMVIPNTRLDDFLASTGGQAAVSGLVQTVGSMVPSVFTKADAGDLKGALQDADNALLTSDAFRNAVVQAVVNALGDSQGITPAAAAATAIKDLLAATHTLDTLIAGFDLSPVATAFAQSNKADVWTIDAGSGQVTLDQPVPLTFGQSMPLQAHVPAQGAQTTLSYHWTNTATVGHLTDGAAGQDSFDSTQDHVTYTANASNPGTDTVTVEAFATTNGQKTSLGTATATLTVKGNQVAIAPKAAAIISGQSQQFTVSVTPAPTVGSLEYHWKSTATVGDLSPNAGRAEFTNTSNKATYASTFGQHGQDTVTVDVTLVNGQTRILLGSDQASVVVQEAQNVQDARFHKVFSGWQVESQADGTYRWGDFWVLSWHVVPQAVFYDLTLKVAPDPTIYSFPTSTQSGPQRIDSRNSWHYLTAAELKAAWPDVPVGNLAEDDVYVPFGHWVFGQQTDMSADTSQVEANFNALVPVVFQVSAVPTAVSRRR